MAASVLFCSLLLFLVFVSSNAQLVFPERIEVPIQSAYLSSNWYFVDDPRPGETAHNGYAAIDNITTDPNNFAHTSQEVGAFLQLTLANPARITYLKIFNRQYYEWRLPPFIIFHTQGSIDPTESNEVLMERPDVHYQIFNTTEAIYDLMMPHSYIQSIRIAVYNRIGFIQVQEVKLYQCRHIPITEVVQSTYYPPGAWAPLMVADFNPKTFAHTNEELNSDPWIEGRFSPPGYQHKICGVHIWNRWWHPIASARLPPFMIALKASPIQVRPNSTILSDFACANEVGLMCTVPQGDGQYEIRQNYFMLTPQVYADRLRVYQKTEGLMNVAEMQAFACEYYDPNFPQLPPIFSFAAANTESNVNTNSTNNFTSPTSAQSERSVTKNRN